MKNEIASFSFRYDNTDVLEIAADIINANPNSYVKITEHWRDSMSSWSTYALIRPKKAILTPDGLVITANHIVLYEPSGDHTYVSSVDRQNRYTVENCTSSDIHIFNKCPRREIELLKNEYKQRLRKINEQKQTLQSERNKVFKALE